MQLAPSAAMPEVLEKFTSSSTTIGLGVGASVPSPLHGNQVAISAVGVAAFSAGGGNATGTGAGAGVSSLSPELGLTDCAALGLPDSAGVAFVSGSTGPSTVTDGSSCARAAALCGTDPDPDRIVEALALISKALAAFSDRCHLVGLASSTTVGSVASSLGKVEERRRCLLSNLS